MVLQHPAVVVVVGLVVVVVVVVVVSSLQLGGLPLYLGRHRHTATWLDTLQSEFGPHVASGHGFLHFSLKYTILEKRLPISYFFLGPSMRQPPPWVTIKASNLFILSARSSLGSLWSPRSSL